MLAGRYRLLEPLGSGGMSVVWRGYDEVLGRRVAVKVLAAEFATDADFRSRIRREAQAAARLSDPHITNVYDYGEARDGTPFVVMELVDGPSLAERLVSGPLSASSIVPIGAGVAAALAVAHAHGLVHRDIKPANVMLSPSGVKVVDFGISAPAGEHGGPVLGTPGYLAPEQQAGAPAAPAADVYALGLLLSRALDHRAPVPAELSALIAECLSPDPAGRPSSSSVAARLAAITGVARPAGRVPVPPESRRTPPRYGTPAQGPAHRSGTRIMPPPPPVPPRLRRPRRWPFVAAAAVLVFLACLAGASLVKRHTGSSAAASMPGRSATPSPSPRPSPSPSLGCRVDYHVTDYGIGFQAQLTLTNSGGADISSWTLAFDFPDDQKLSVGWGGVWKQDGSRVTVRDILINGSMKPGKSVGIGFVGTYKGKNDEPQQFSLNDVSCGQSDG